MVKTAGMGYSRNPTGNGARPDCGPKFTDPYETILKYGNMGWRAFKFFLRLADNEIMIHSVSGNIHALGRYTREMAGIADRVSTAFVPESDADIAKEFVDMLIVKNAFTANVAAIRSRDEMIGTLLDVFA